MKKIGIAALVVLIGIVLVFSLFTFVKCDNRAKNYLSQLHMVIAPVKEENPDWNSIKTALKNRCGKLCEFRFFEVYENKYAILEVTGARDPNMLASMLMMKGDVKILDDKGQKIAADKEIQLAGLMTPNNGTASSAIFGVQIDSIGSDRLKGRMASLGENKKLSVSLFVDDVKVLTTSLGKSDQQDLLIFQADRETEAQLLDYLGQAITYKLPYVMAIDKNNSFIIPPQTDKSAPIDFQDILGKIIINEQK